MTVSVVIGLIGRAKTDEIGSRTFCRVVGVDCLVFWTQSACFIGCDQRSVRWALYSHTFGLFVIELFQCGTFLAPLCRLIKESFSLILTNSTKRDPIFISQLSSTLLTLPCGIINKLPLLTEDTLLLPKVEHSFRAIKALFRKVDGKGSILGTRRQVKVRRDLKQIQLVLILRGVPIEPIPDIKVGLEHVLIEVDTA